MTWIVASMRWIMLAAGALTCTMVYGAIAPQAALRSTFGEALDGPLAEVVVVSDGHAPELMPLAAGNCTERPRL